MSGETAGVGVERVWVTAATAAASGARVRGDLGSGPQGMSSEAFTRLYEESHARIYNLAARILNDRDQAADVTQDVFLATYRRLPELPQDVNMERWMYRVTVNACFDLLRRRRRRGEPVVHDVDDLPDHMDAYERAELTHAVESALSDLSPRHRTALVLKDLHGFGNGEIAEIMGISRGSAGVLLLRARAAFRRAFSRGWPAGGKSVAGLGLALLPALPVPAVLEAPPFLAGSALATAAVLPSAGGATVSIGALASSGAVPAAAGAGGGIAAAAVAKVALVAVGACALLGGGIAAVTTQSGGNELISDTVVAGVSVAGSTASGNSELAARGDLAMEQLQRERARADRDAEGGSGGARNGAVSGDGRSTTQSGGSWSSPAPSTGRRGEGSGSESGGSGSSGAAGTTAGGAMAAGQTGAAGEPAGTATGGTTSGGSGSAGGGGSF